jgi:hypothetical protein
VRGKIAAEFAYLGEQSLKNIARPLRVYRISPTAPEQVLSFAAAVYGLVGLFLGSLLAELLMAALLRQNRLAH